MTTSPTSGSIQPAYYASNASAPQGNYIAPPQGQNPVSYTSSTISPHGQNPGPYYPSTAAPQGQGYYIAPPQGQNPGPYISGTAAPQSQAYYLPPQGQNPAPSTSSTVAPQGQNQMQIDPNVLAMAMQIVNNQNAQQVSQTTQSVLTFPDGSTYTGEVQNGKPHGKGFLIFAPTDAKERQKYEGQFYNGSRQGYGIMTWRSGQKYDGAWANDTFEGRGTIYYPDGRKYDGMFQNGLYSGKGKFTYPEGKFYEGEFSNHAKNGYGEFHFPDGEKYVGIFKDDDFWNGVKTYYVRGNHTALRYPRTVVFENGKAKSDGCTLV